MLPEREAFVGFKPPRLLVVRRLGPRFDRGIRQTLIQPWTGKAPKTKIIFYLATLPQRFLWGDSCKFTYAVFGLSRFDHKRYECLEIVG